MLEMRGGDDGSVLYYEGTVDNITEKKSGKRRLNKLNSIFHYIQNHEFLINTNGINRIGSISRDIARHKEPDIAIRESEAKFRQFSFRY